MQVDIFNIIDFKAKATAFADSFEIAIVLDSNNYSDPYSKFDFLVAFEAKRTLSCKAGEAAFEKLEYFQRKSKSWIFGGLGYDLKNELEDLSSGNNDGLGFPDLLFFDPKHLFLLKGTTLKIISESAGDIWNSFSNFEFIGDAKQIEPVNISRTFNPNDYLETVKAIQAEIKQGNIYETNFCMEYFVIDFDAHPLHLFNDLNRVSPTPFSTYFKWYPYYIISATPERFLSKRNDKLISQPIKGTAKRAKTSSEDEIVKKLLHKNEKERQENVMIVDLVRNDLTKSAKRGSVKVEELFGIYSFEQVHQMISTVVCEAKEGLSAIDIIKNTFPMGSMTGAPKIKAMQLMEKYERSKRGMYSGAIGYFDADGDFDFNVIIRTMLYNKKEKYLSFHVGSAITHNAIPEEEYQECLAKIEGILSVLNTKT